MAWLEHMTAQLDADLPSPGDFASAARGWLGGALTDVFPLAGTHLSDEPLRASDVPGPAVSSPPRGRPGRVMARLLNGREHPVFGVREIPYSPRAWARFLASLDDYPFSAGIDIYARDQEGTMLPGTGVRVRVARDPWSPAWTSFTFTVSAGYTGWPESGATQDRWAEFVKARAASTGASFGSMTDDAWPGETALHRATMSTATGIADSRTVLRGYSWVTVIAPELAGRLGGAAALTATGAFYEVSALPSGAVWLRATPTINEFTGDRIHAVFQALAPVLVTGTTTFRWGETYRLVEGVNSADYQ